MAAIQCKTEIPAVPGLNDNELTVGREFFLVCEGEFSRSLKQEKLHFVLEPQNKYILKLLNFEFRSLTQADLKVTSYQAGRIQFENLTLTDGEQTLSLGPLQFDVQSVLPKQELGSVQQQKIEPFGPLGPVTMSVPMLYWTILASVLGLLCLIFVVRILRGVQRRNMRARLREHDSAMTPLAQFHQNFRRLQRHNSVFFGDTAVEAVHIPQCLEESHAFFRLFLTRRFQVPAMEWGDRLILKEIKKYHPEIFKDHSEELKTLFKEYSRALVDKANLKETDVLNIANHTRVLVEKLARVP